MILTSISVGITTVAFLVYHFTGESGRMKNFFLNRFSETSLSLCMVLFNRLLGFFLFGGLPLLAIIYLVDIPLADFGFRMNSGFQSWFWIAILSPLIAALNLFNAPRKQNLNMYPQIRSAEWTPFIVVVSAITWVAYLLAYEFMFRGFLLFALYYELGMVAAITINTALYSLIHIPKGKTEAIGAIPLGVLLCYLTLITGNILIACVVHIVMALTNEWFSLRVHPEMKIVRK
jgi:membrane protease YdiL (CAAX protease family)